MVTTSVMLTQLVQKCGIPESVRTETVEAFDMIKDYVLDHGPAILESVRSGTIQVESFLTSALEKSTSKTSTLNYSVGALSGLCLVLACFCYNRLALFLPLILLAISSPSILLVGHLNSQEGLQRDEIKPVKSEYSASTSLYSRLVSQFVRLTKTSYVWEVPTGLIVNLLAYQVPFWNAISAFIGVATVFFYPILGGTILASLMLYILIADWYETIARGVITLGNTEKASVFAALRGYKPVKVTNSFSNSCFWDAAAECFKEHGVDFSGTAEGARKMLWDEAKTSEWSFILDSLDWMTGGNELYATAISKIIGKRVWYHLEGDEKLLSYGEGEGDAVLFRRMGTMFTPVTHWEYCSKTSSFLPILMNFCTVLFNTNSVYLLGFGLVSIVLSVGVPIVGLPCLALLVSIVSTIGLLSFNFKMPTSYLKCRIAKHFVFKKMSSAQQEETRFKGNPICGVDGCDHVFVFGCAGADFFFDKLSNIVMEYHRAFPTAGFLVMTDSQDEERVRKVMDATELRYSVCSTALETPGSVISWRYAPMFFGDPKTKYHVRDVDWQVTTIERASYMMQGNLSLNPIILGFGPIWGGAVDFVGSSFREHIDLFTGSYHLWKEYGWDEEMVSGFQWRFVMSRLFFFEQLALFFVSRFKRLHPDSVLLVSNRALKYVDGDATGITWHEKPISTWGSLEWLWKLHMSSAGEMTLCSYLSKHKLTKTSMIWSLFGLAPLNQLGFGLMLVFNHVQRVYCRAAFDSGVDEGLEKLKLRKSSLVGSAAVFGFFPAFLRSQETRSDGVKAVLQDDQVKHEYEAWERSRRRRNALGLFPYATYKPNLRHWILYAALLANPIGASLGWIGAQSVGHPSPDQWTVSSAMFLCLNPLISSCGLVSFLNSTLFNNEVVEKCCDFVALTGGNIHTAKVGFYSLRPAVQLDLQIESPVLNENLTSCEDLVEQLPCFNGWTFSWGDIERKIDLPPGMVNLKCSSAIALQESGLINWRLYDNCAIAGSGGGGFLQGMLNAGFRNQLDAYTLPEAGYTMSEVVKRQSSSARVREVLQDISTVTTKYRLVVSDMTTSPMDEIWIKDMFEYRDDAFFADRRNLQDSESMVQFGGDFVCSLWLDDVMRQVELFDYLSVHYKSLDVVLDPLTRGPVLCWYIARHKRIVRNSRVGSILLGELVVRDQESHWDLVQLMGDWKSRVQGDEFYTCHVPWMHRLQGLFKLGVVDFETVAYDQSHLNLRAGRNCSTLEQMVESSGLAIERYTWGPISKLERTNVVDMTGSFKCFGRMIKPPVQDRVFNTGVDLVHEELLRCSGVLPLELEFTVPPQTNYEVLNGLFRRYAFQSQPVDMQLYQPVIDYLEGLVCDAAGGFSFQWPTWDDLALVATKSSSMGYMSDLAYKNVGDALRNGKQDLDTYFNKLISGESINHYFHASPKVEKKEIDGEPIIPRLFQYKTGEVRLAEMRLFKRVNDFFGASGKFFPSMKGDIFDKSERIVRAFERFEDARGIEIECSKFDGHKEVELTVAAREIMARACESGLHGEVAATVMRSTAFFDMFGTCVLCSGHVVEFQRCSQKSGLWDTSINNKIYNTIVAMTTVCQALGIDPDQVLSRCEIMIEGDDGLIVAEEKDAHLILRARNKIYELAGVPQRSFGYLLTSPEDSRFCSHGATRLSSGDCVPVRSMHEVLGRLIVPVVNNSFQLNYQMLSRSLSSGISFAIMYCYIPEIRNYWKVLRSVVPKDVFARAVTSEKWKIVYNLGGVNLIGFDLGEFIQNRFSRNFLEGRCNPKAVRNLDLKLLEGFSGLAVTDVLASLKILARSPFSEPALLWYSEHCQAYDVLADLYVMSKRVSCSVMTESSARMRELLTGGLVQVPFAWGSLQSCISRAKGMVFLIFSPSEVSRVRTLAGILSPSVLKRQGFRGSEVSAYVLGETDVAFCIKTSKLGLISVLILAWLFAVLALPSPIGKTVYVKNGVNVESKDGKVLTSLDSLLNFSYQPKKPKVVASLGLAQALARRHVQPRKDRLEMSRVAFIRSLAFLAQKFRRFGVISYDSQGNRRAALFYKKKWFESKSEPWADVNAIASILGVSPSEVLKPSEWSYNGGMLTVQEWRGTMTYGQFERPQLLFKKLEGLIQDVVFVLRIDDCPMCDAFDRHPNRYLFDRPLVYPNRMIPVFGENTGEGYFDLPKPFDADILPGSTGFVSFRSKKEAAVFRGGFTGMGTESQTNSRVWLINNRDQLNSVFPCDFGITQALDRLCRDLSGNLGLRTWQNFSRAMSYQEMSQYQVIVVVEGNEAADRVGRCLETGSLILYIRPVNCLGQIAWWTPLLADKDNCLICDLTVASVRQALRWVKSNQEEASVIAGRGRKLGNWLLDTDNQVSYMLGCLNFVCNSKDNLQYVEQCVRWAQNTRVRHACIFYDVDHKYVHGTALSLVAKSTTYGKVNSDIGDGLLICEIPLQESLFMKYRSVTPLDFELNELMSLLSSVNCESLYGVMADRLGTLGSGNHFIELVDNGLESLLLVHTGSRGFFQLALNSLGVRLDQPFDLVHRNLLEVASAIAKLNRQVLARGYGGSKVRQSVAHNQVLDELEGLDGPVLLKDMVVCLGETWLLGSNGTGVAHLRSRGTLAPHGTGGKGSRTRDLAGIESSRWYKTVVNIREPHP
jgi:hypothetical protein